jgi:hypothetical protein
MHFVLRCDGIRVRGVQACMTIDSLFASVTMGSARQTALSPFPTKKTHPQIESVSGNTKK